MKTYLRGIVLNILLIGLWAFLSFFLLYNAVEERIIDDSIAGYLGILILLLILIQMIFFAIYLVKSVSRKQYFRAILYLIILVGFVFIGKMVWFATMVYFVGAVGGH